MSSVRSKAKQQNRKGTQSLPHPNVLASSKRQAWILALVLAVTTLAVYYPASHYPFVNYDDDAYVTQNAHVQSGLSWDTVRWAFTTYEFVNWHPLTWISHALDYQMFQLDSGGHHDTSVVLHVLNALLLFWVLLRATGAAGPSFVVAALFALHPINVESVAWIAERKNLLSTLFFLLALGAYTSYTRKPGVIRYVVVAALFALGLMSKPQVITFPFVLLLWDYWPLQRMFAEHTGSSPGNPAASPGKSFSRLVLEKLPLFAICAASAVVTVRAARTGGTLSGIYFHSFSMRVANSILSYARYVGKMFWPSSLALYYPYPTWGSLMMWQVIAAAAFLLVVTAFVIAARRRRYLLVGWLWFLGTLVPVIGLTQVGIQAMADRYAYLSLVGLFIMICWGIADWAKQRHVPRLVLQGVSAVVLLALLVTTHQQLSYWDDNVTLWTHTVAVTKDNYMAEDHLGGALLADGQTEAAMPIFIVRWRSIQTIRTAT